MWVHPESVELIRCTYDLDSPFRIIFPLNRVVKIFWIVVWIDPCQFRRFRIREVLEGSIQPPTLEWKGKEIQTSSLGAFSCILT